MAQLLQTLALVTVLPLIVPLGVQAHMEMRWPYAFRSKYDPAITDPDYDNTSPLLSDGSNYPCKGYQDLASSQVSKVTYTPGQTYNITLAGTATHMGGSCQISLSYDNGQSFKVIKSMIGGCPLKDDWDFTVPSNAPASDDAILAWTWFNLVGNREMYMNCARVTIAEQSVQRYRRCQSKRQSSFSGLPDNFACNIDNGCTTIERREVVFPNPGPIIERGTDAVTPDPGPGFILSSTPTGNAFSSISPNATATAGFYPYLNGTSPTTTYFRPTGTGILSSVYFNSTSILTVYPRYSTPSSSLISTLTTPTATPGFFYLSNSTNSSTTLISTTTASVAGNSTTLPPFANSTTSNILLISTTLPNNFTATTTTSPDIAVVTTFLTSVVLTTALSSTNSTSLPSPSAFNTTLITATPTTFTTLTASSISSAPTATIIPTYCTPGAFVCNSVTSFSQCVPDGAGSGTFVFMGSVASGTQCVGDTIVSENDGACTPDGSLQCDGETAFYICNEGGLIAMGAVAPGTVCLNGTISSA